MADKKTTFLERRAEIDREIERRVRLVAKIQNAGPRGIALARSYYANRPVEWVQDFCWTYDPRNPSLEVPLPAYLPMTPAPIQVELLEWFQWLRSEGKDGWLPKSRGVGASYFACAYLDHQWLFNDGFAGSLLSMTEEEVDKRDDPDSLFQKLRIILEWIPRWQWPKGFEGVGQQSAHDNHRRLVNPETGAILTGKIGKSPGRGGRRSIVFVDEAAHIRNLVEVRRALRDNTNCIIEMSTYQGTGEPFYRSAAAGGPRVFLITWHDIPWYDDAWYERKKAQYADDPVGFAQEVEADPSQSVENVVIPQKWVQACVGFNAGNATPLPIVAGLDVAGSGKNKNVLVMRRGPWVEMPRVKHEGNTTRTAHWAREECEEFGTTRLIYDSIGVGAGVGDTLRSMPPNERPQFEVEAFNAGESPSGQKWPNGKTSAERFRNKRAEAWWMLRDRCRKTFEVVEGIAEHPFDECISLPPDPDLLIQLSQPTYFHTNAGKIQIESKEDMVKRGIPSPDHADALMMSEAQFILPRTIDFKPTPRIR